VILLAKVGLLDVLQHLGAPVVIPKPAALEIQRGSPSDPAVQALANANWLVTVDPGPIPQTVLAQNLGPGESAVIAYALANPGSGVLLDDQGARSVAAALAIPHQGTLALVVLAKTRGLITAARPVVDQLRQQGMYLSDQVANQALSQVGE
jgi:predicted nucleic acid-binding protein